MRTVALIALLLTVIACDDPAQPTNNKNLQGATKPEKAATPAVAPADTPTTKKSAKDQPDKGKTLAAQFRGHLNAGRKLVRAKKYKEGIVKFEKALKLDPNHARGLSELGWAAFNAGDLDRAETANLASVRFARDNISIRGASLYNLGRIEEQRGNTKAAAVYYKRSLKIRPNKVVTRRLQDLGSEGESAKIPADIKCHMTPIGKGSLKQAIRAYTKTNDYQPSPRDSKEEGVIKVIKVNGDKLTSAAVFGLHHTDGDVVFAHLGVKYDGTWHILGLIASFNPGAFGINEAFELQQLEARQLIPGGEPEIFVRLTHDRYDIDMGIDEYDSEKRQDVHVFGIQKNKPSSLLFVQETYNYERDRLYQTDEENIDKSFSTKGLPIRKKKATDLKFDPAGGKVTLTGKKDTPVTHKPGTFDLASFPQPCSDLSLWP